MISTIDNFDAVLIGVGIGLIIVAIILWRMR